ncbi:MAG: FAD-dependent oxidoreductase [Armatimonadetes bacterium]|nr:MAG: FAD-dependent oxidoreductase [Armatimonadota bacterium]
MFNPESPVRVLVVGGGPGGQAAATTAARFGADVTLVEDQIVGGAAHLWDCIPSKAMVSSSIRMRSIRNAEDLGISDPGAVEVDMGLLSARASRIANTLAASMTEMLDSQGVEIIRGRARFVGPTKAIAATENGDVEIAFDRAVIATGSRPRIPEWAKIDGERVITTREAYHLPELPGRMVIVGSGVTGVEMTHIFSSLGSDVALLVSRHHVLPHRDAEVATVLEEDFLGRGVELLKGSRASAISRSGDTVSVSTEDGRVVTGTHALLAVGSLPNSENLGLDLAGVEQSEGYITVDEYQRTSTPHIYAAGDVTGQMLLSSVATMQGTKIARHILGHEVHPIDYRKVAQGIFTEPEIASVGLEEVDAAAEGRKVRITKVPLAPNARALIQGDTKGFIKLVSDPATRIVLGGTVVGHHASELIASIAVATTARLSVDILVETLMVHPSLTESIAEAAE